MLNATVILEMIGFACEVYNNTFVLFRVFRVIRGSYFMRGTRGAGDNVKPGVERSGTPGTTRQGQYKARGAGDRPYVKDEGWCTRQTC